MDDPTMHPPSYRLEELAVGGRDPSIQEHIDGCEACRLYVERARQGAGAFLEARGAMADDFARRTRQKLELGSQPEPPGWRGATLLWFAGALAMFGLLVLWRSMRDDGDQRLARGPNVVELPTGEMRFKGGIELAAIVDRGERQERITTAIVIRPGDRLRAEVSVDDDRETVVGFLEQGGAWAELLPRDKLTKGTHLSAQALKFDAHPTTGWLLAGSPDAVQRARSSGDLAGVAVLPVRPEPAAP